MGKKSVKLHLSGFTLMEILIVVSLIAILSGMTLFVNMKSYLQKARDSKRKQDLGKIARILEDYYNDQIRYPAADPDTGSFNGSPWGSPFSPYIPMLPKDPLSPNQDYYYQSDPISQNFFALYARLENKDDLDIDTTGCKTGCGPGKTYNYVIHSNNVIMLSGLPNGIAPPIGAEPGGPSGGGPPAPGEPTPTTGPSPTLGPSPTGPPTPTPTTPPRAQCGHGQCCLGWCGGDETDEPFSAFCTGGNQRCAFHPPYAWGCDADCSCDASCP